jgi:pyruvate,water dikinase
LKLLVNGKIEIPGASQEALRYREALAETISVCPAEYRTDLLELIETTRAYIELDDTEHYETTRLQVPLRTGLLALGQRFVNLGILAEPPDIFFGRSATIDDAVRAGNFIRLQAEIRLNKESFRKVEGQPAETAIPTSVGSSNGSVALEGLPCSAGYVEGRACVVNTADEFKKLEKGAILVARATPPAWSPLFYVASAIVTEAGGALSHGAVLARELRLPAIMGVKGLLRELRDGDRIGVDGNTGRISRLD